MTSQTLRGSLLFADEAGPSERAAFAHKDSANAMLKSMQPHRASAQVHKGVVTVTGVPAAEGETVEVIVIRGAGDVERYARAPVSPGEFSDVEDVLGWDGEGWDEFANEAR